MGKFYQLRFNNLGGSELHRRQTDIISGIPFFLLFFFFEFREPLKAHIDEKLLQRFIIYLLLDYVYVMLTTIIRADY